jgi:group I intron endonuclease
MQNLPNPGIYKITCIPTQKVYIGQSISIKKRIQYHRQDLEKNRHHNDYLQAAHNKYGIENFKFEAIEYPEDTSPENLTAREQYWIDFFDSMNPEKGFNLKEAGPAGQPNEDTRKKMGAAHKKNWETRDRTVTEEEKNRLREISKKGTEVLQNRPMSEETKRKISEANRGRQVSEEEKERLREMSRKQAELNRGKKRPPMSEEQKEKLREVHVGRKASEETKRKMSESHKRKAIEDPDYRKNRSRSTSEETKEKLRETTRAYWERKKQANINLTLEETP